jgi:hypothetical protein
MRTHTSRRIMPLLALTGLLILTYSALATAQGVQRTVSVTEIGTVVPQGKEFRVELNQEQVSKLYPQYATSQKNARLSQPVGREEFNQLIQRDVLRKIRTLFPNGLPDGTTDTGGTARIKIHITVKLSDPPEFGLSIEW